MIKVGSKVKVIGVTERDTQVYGKVLAIDLDGLAIVELEDKILAVLPSALVAQ